MTQPKHDIWLTTEDLSVLEEIVESNLRMRLSGIDGSYHRSYGRWKVLTRILDEIREARNPRRPC